MVSGAAKIMSAKKKWLSSGPGPGPGSPPIHSRFRKGQFRHSGLTRPGRGRGSGEESLSRSKPIACSPCERPPRSRRGLARPARAVMKR